MVYNYTETSIYTQWNSTLSNHHMFRRYSRHSSHHIISFFVKKSKNPTFIVQPQVVSFLSWLK